MTSPNIEIRYTLARGYLATLVKEGRRSFFPNGKAFSSFLEALEDVKIFREQNPDCSNIIKVIEAFTVDDDVIATFDITDELALVTAILTFS
jgi:hypothetical protein